MNEWIVKYNRSKTSRKYAWIELVNYFGTAEKNKRKRIDSQMNLNQNRSTTKINFLNLYYIYNSTVDKTDSIRLTEYEVFTLTRHSRDHIIPWLIKYSSPMNKKNSKNTQWIILTGCLKASNTVAQLIPVFELTKFCKIRIHYLL